jgi:hypothetical protein
MTPPNGRLDDAARDQLLFQMRDELERIGAVTDALAVVLRRVELATGAPRRQAIDDGLLTTIHRVMGATAFTTKDVIAYAARDRSFADALTVARAATAKALGRRLRALAKHPHQWRVDRVGREAAGLLWTIERASDDA